MTTAMTRSDPTRRKTSHSSSRRSARPDAQTLAKRQREISVSEFFAKNRHLLGFDNPRKALLTTVKEAVDNALDACEEAGVLPKLFIGIEQLAETRFRITVRDNGPGIVRSQVENIFGKLLYGSKFHRLKMSRGQQGIGIAAAGMYGLMTTGQPMVIHTKPRKNKPCHRVVLAIDTQKNRADVTDEEEHYDFPHDTGTEVQIELEGRFNRGRQSVDEYIEQTAIANPHARIIYRPPRPRNGNDTNGQDDQSLIDDLHHARQLLETATGTTQTPSGTLVYPRTVKELPEEPREIKPHPDGLEFGALLKMLKTTEHKQLGGFLQHEFSRISQKVSGQICAKADLTARTWVASVSHNDADRLYKAMREMRFMAPPTNCLSPIGVRQILAGLLKGVKAEFYTATTREPAVYRGNPFQIEVGMAYGGDLPGNELGRVIRFANRVPLLYQQSACCAFKAVVETNWRNYGLSQGRGALPEGPLIIMVHMASVWVPFTSESKEAIADYDEIRKEIRLGLSECGRKLNTYIKRRARIKREGERRGVFERYIGEVVRAMQTIKPDFDVDQLRQQFEAVARTRTEIADMQFDADGNPIRATQSRTNGNGSLDKDDAIVIVDQPGSAAPDDDQDTSAPAVKHGVEKTTDDEQTLFE